MPPGRPRQNLALVQLKGQDKKNPSRYVDRDPQLDTHGAIGEPPEEFNCCSDTLKLIALWKKLVSEAPVGLLTASDREYLAKVCRLGVEAQRPATKNYLRALQLYTQALKGLGMTPDGRAVRGIGGKAAVGEQSNKLDEFTAKRRKRA